MSVHELKRFRIDCEWQYEGCTGSVLVEDVADRYEAEAAAEALGWRMGLSSGCPSCEAVYVKARAEKGLPQ